MSEPLLKPREGWTPPPEPAPQEHECPVCGWHESLRTGKKPRSGKHHRHFWAMIRAAYYHWPHDHPNQFDQHSRKVGEEEARQYLLVKVGWGERVGSVPMKSEVPSKWALALAFRLISMTEGKGVPIVRGADIVIVKPKSIKFSECPHEDFVKVSDKVRIEIESVCGRPIDELIATTPLPDRKRRKPEP